MKPENVAFVQNLLRKRSGIVLEQTKTYLVEARLGPVARRLGLQSIDELIDTIRRRPEKDLHQEVLEAMVTTETSFFRDVHPFETLKQVVIPRLIHSRRETRELTFWSAACASGQEIHSLAMLLRENFPELENWKLTLLASDVSEEMLHRTREGLYSQLEVNRGIPTRLLIRFFQREGLSWRLTESIRKMVEVRKVNLIEGLPYLPKMDIIFLRNVLIYFDVETRKSIIEKISRQLKSDGYLFVGGAETMIGMNESLIRERISNTSVYRITGGSEA